MDFGRLAAGKILASSGHKMAEQNAKGETMKERPILFSGPMVRAILEGRKTATRRIVKPQPPVNYDSLWPEFNPHGTVKPIVWFWSKSTSGSGSEQQDLLGIAPSPYGKIGDRLWVRETWGIDPYAHHKGHSEIHYRATSNMDSDYPIKWKPSIHMPRLISRITLEITDVRVERLQEITEADAIAEGTQCAGVPASISNCGAFAKLWQSINGPNSWEQNPWVWALTFKKASE
jgi:hypothetical protein